MDVRGAQRECAGKDCLECFRHAPRRVHGTNIKEVVANGYNILKGAHQLGNVITIDIEYAACYSLGVFLVFVTTPGVFKVSGRGEVPRDSKALIFQAS